MYRSIHLNIHARPLQDGLGVHTSTNAPSVSLAAPRTQKAFISMTESVPFILMSTTEDPFGRIIRTPQIYWQTFTSGFSVSTMNIHPIDTVAVNVNASFQSPQ